MYTHIYGNLTIGNIQKPSRWSRGFRNQRILSSKFYIFVEKLGEFYERFHK
jgi:hypothetical protein